MPLPKYKLVRLFTLLAALCWLVLLLIPSLRTLVSQHVMGSFYTISYPTNFYLNNEIDKDTRWMNPGNDIQKVEKLVADYPNDPAIIAYYLCWASRNQIRRSDGPLWSNYPDWSVRASSTESVQDEIYTPEETKKNNARFLSLARRGQRLEPNNTFFDWMVIIGLLGARREDEIDPVLQGAAKKTHFDDHCLDRMQASMRALERLGQLSSPLVRTIAYWGVELRHLGPMAQATRYLAQRTMGLRLQKKHKEALMWARQSLHLARTVRLASSLDTTSAMGRLCESIIIKEAKVPLLGLRPTVLGSPVRQLAAHPESLLRYANDQKDLELASYITNEWLALNNWIGAEKALLSTGSIRGLIKQETYEGFGFSQKAARYFLCSLLGSVGLWFLLSIFLWKKAVSPNPYEILSLYGAALSLLFIGGVLVYEYMALRGIKLPLDLYLETEAIIFPLWDANSGTSRILFGTIPLLLIWVALMLSRAPKVKAHEPEVKPYLWTQDENEFLLEDFYRSVDKVLAFCIRAIKWFFKNILILAWVIGSTILWLGWPEGHGALPETNGQWVGFFLREGFYLSLSLVVFPAFFLVAREYLYRWQQRKVLNGHLVALVKLRAMLSGFLVAGSIVFALVIWNQERMTRQFNEQFAPIEQGQMMKVLMQRQGVPFK